MASTFKIWFRRSRNHPHRRALQSDLQQHRQFNPFSRESRDVIKAAGNIELCELLDVEPKAQCKVCLSYWTSASSTAHAGTSCEMERKRTRDTSSTLLTSFRFPVTTSRKGDPTATVMGRKKGITSTSSRIRSTRNARREISCVFTTSSSVMKDSARTWLKMGRTEEDMSWDGQSGERGSHTPHYCRRK